MRRVGKIVSTFVLVVGLACASADACSEHVHYSKAQIEAADFRLYEHDLKARDVNLARFDQTHPLVGRLLGDQEFHEQELTDWKSHPLCFEHHFPTLCPVIEGEMLYDKKNPVVPPNAPTPAGESPPVITENSVPFQNSGSNFPDGVRAASVPEPSTAVLMLTGVVVGLIGLSRRLIAAQLRASRR